jgi:soluble lytic murein transglycosylase
MQIRRAALRDVLAADSDIGEGDLFDPDYNLRVGTAYLRMMVERFGGDLYLALAAYNWGPTSVSKARKAHPGLTGRELVIRHAPRETRAYCRRVLKGRPTRLSLSQG